MKPTITPYLNFDGKTKEAMGFYKEVFGGELFMQTFEEAKMARTDKEKGNIMHASLTSDSISLMASDGHPGQKVVFGDSVHLSLGGTDEALLTKYFNDLAQGGKVVMPLAKQFWGDTFGMLTDKYGIHWMVNISSEKKKLS